MQHLNAHMCKHAYMHSYRAGALPSPALSGYPTTNKKSQTPNMFNSHMQHFFAIPPKLISPQVFRKKLVTVPTETSSMNLWRPINMEATNHKDINHMAPAARTEQAMTVLPFRANSAKIVGSSNQSTVGSSNLKVHCLFGGASLFTVVACVATTSSSESSQK